MHLWASFVIANAPKFASGQGFDGLDPKLEYPLALIAPVGTFSLVSVGIAIHLPEVWYFNFAGFSFSGY